MIREKRPNEYASDILQLIKVELDKVPKHLRELTTKHLTNAFIKRGSTANATYRKNIYKDRATTGELSDQVPRNQPKQAGTKRDSDLFSNT